jgi:ribosomal protein S18 acetylase RimI-like enzyme
MVQYPKVFRGRDGRAVGVRPLVPDDLVPLLAFFASLPEEDRLHLRVDVTRRDIVERRMFPPPHWNVLRLIALSGERIVAEGSIEHRVYGFEAHVGQIRLIVAPDFRGTGLAHYLGLQAVAHGVAENLAKIEAHLMGDAGAAIHCFERLGFEREGSLEGFARDVRGGDHDLLILSLRI